MGEVPDEVREKMRAFLDDQVLGSEDDAITQWWRTYIPALNGLTPEEQWEYDPDAVWQLIDAYRSGSFS